ncbi:hypothetical protein Q5752_004367 [Cryptotrichosporon argae]
MSQLACAPRPPQRLPHDLLVPLSAALLDDDAYRTASNLSLLDRRAYELVSPRLYRTIKLSWTSPAPFLALLDRATLPAEQPSAPDGSAQHRAQTLLQHVRAVEVDGAAYLGDHKYDVDARLSAALSAPPALPNLQRLTVRDPRDIRVPLTFWPGQQILVYRVLASCARADLSVHAARWVDESEPAPFRYDAVRRWAAAATVVRIADKVARSCVHSARHNGPLDFTLLGREAVVDFAPVVIDDDDAADIQRRMELTELLEGRALVGCLLARSPRAAARKVESLTLVGLFPVENGKTLAHPGPLEDWLEDVAGWPLSTPAAAFIAARMTAKSRDELGVCPVCSMCLRETG